MVGGSSLTVVRLSISADSLVMQPETTPCPTNLNAPF